MATLEEVRSWRGMTMVDADGDKIGEIQDVYLDRQTGEPEWVTVRTGLFGTKVSFVPVRDAQAVGDEVRVPFQKEQVKDAPRVEADDELSPEEERQLYEHYGRSDYGEWRGEDRTTALGLPEEPQGRVQRSGEAGSGGPGDGGAEGKPVVVGVRLRRVVIVAPARPGTGADEPTSGPGAGAGGAAR